MVEPTARYVRIQRTLSVLAIAAVAVGFVSCERRGRVDGADLRDPLFDDPLQGPTRDPEFSLDYGGLTYDVRPVATYELFGLVRSHNNVGGIADSYHDGESLDTKDLCVMWGANLEGDFNQVEVKNSSWTCWYRWPRGFEFHGDSLSNNHLVTDLPAVRETIARVRVGDQVHIKGLLVDYRSSETPDFWRKSSTTRDDEGGTACEVVFVDEIEILERGTPGWYLAHRLASLALLLLVGLKGTLYWRA